MGKKKLYKKLLRAWAAHKVSKATALRLKLLKKWASH